MRTDRATLADGTELAHVARVSGEPVVFVHGSLADLSCRHHRPGDDPTADR